MSRLLFICHGNICRSVMAEMMMKDLCHRAGVLERFDIDSAAVSTEEIGNDIYPPAKRILHERGVPFTSHAARQVTIADYHRFDHLICADRSNIRLLSRIIGDDSEHKVSLMMTWAGEQRDVSDPWYTGDFAQAYQDIHTACTALLHALS